MAMNDTPDLQGKHALDSTRLAAASKQQPIPRAQSSRVARRTLWGIGMITLIIVSVVVHMHPAPWPYEVQTTLTIQHLQLWPWIIALIIWASIVDNPIPSAINLIAWLIVLSVIGVVVWRKGGSPAPWFVTAIFISIGTAVMDGINSLIGHLVARPRPTSPPIHVLMPENGIPSFPSGHVENDLVYYGFLLYLSFTKPVRQWRFRWILIPFQLYASLNILFIGYSRMLEGSHWLDDALAGYLSGALLLVLLIFLYQWTLATLATRHMKKKVDYDSSTPQA